MDIESSVQVRECGYALDLDLLAVNDLVLRVGKLHDSGFSAIVASRSLDRSGLSADNRVGYDIGYAFNAIVFGDTLQVIPRPIAEHDLEILGHPHPIG